MVPFLGKKRNKHPPPRGAALKPHTKSMRPDHYKALWRTQWPPRDGPTVFWRPRPQRLCKSGSIPSKYSNILSEGRGLSPENGVGKPLVHVNMVTEMDPLYKLLPTTWAFQITHVHMNHIVLHLVLYQRTEDQGSRSEASVVLKGPDMSLICLLIPSIVERSWRDYLVIYCMQSKTSERLQSFDAVTCIYTKCFNWKFVGFSLVGCLYDALYYWQESLLLTLAKHWFCTQS